jgi:hypothetical protein
LLARSTIAPANFLFPPKWAFRNSNGQPATLLAASHKIVLAASELLTKKGSTLPSPPYIKENLLPCPLIPYGHRNAHRFWQQGSHTYADSGRHRQTARPRQLQKFIKLVCTCSAQQKVTQSTANRYWTSSIGKSYAKHSKQTQGQACSLMSATANQ